MPHTMVAAAARVGPNVHRALDDVGGASRLNEILRGGGILAASEFTAGGAHSVRNLMTEDRRKQLTASACASGLTTLLLTPMSVVKTRVQAGGAGAGGVIRNILQRESLLSFWRPAPVSLAMTMPSMMLYISCYEGSKEAFAEALPSSMSGAATPLAAFGSRCITGAVMAPAELVRTVQASHGGNGKGAVEVARGMLRDGGALRFYRGVGATMARDAPYSALYWSALETLKPVFASVLYGGGGGEGGAQSGATFLAGLFAGTGACFVTHPFDVVKTRLQVTAIRGGGVGGAGAAVVATGLSSIVRQEGVHGLFSGLGIRLATCVPGSGIAVTVYDFLKSRL